MDEAALSDLFAGLGPLRFRRMFGGLGVYRGEAMFALVAFDAVWMKTDARLAESYRAAGSEPFIYAGKSRPVAMSFWRLPDDALDDPEAALDWARLSLGPAEAAAEARQPGRSRRR